jgi:ATP adenylyltransferase
MERIWAPWRIEYVQNPKAARCVFCQAAENPEGFHVVMQGSQGFIMLNAYPYNSGHLLIVPYAHVPSIVELTEEEVCELTRMARAAIIAMDRCMRPGGYNLGVNMGEVAGAGIAEHVHLHVVPRWQGDTNFMSVVANTRVVPEALEACAERLRPVLLEVCDELGLSNKTAEGKKP